MKIYSVLHPEHQITLAVCKTKRLAKKWVEENTKKYQHLKYRIEENEIIENENTIMSQLQTNNIMNNASYDKCSSLKNVNCYGTDYWLMLGIKRGCIFSIWCGDINGYLYLFDKCMLIPSNITKLAYTEFEFKQVMKFWEENKDRYSDFLKWREENLTHHFENGVGMCYGGYEKDWQKFGLIEMYDVD